MDKKECIRKASELHEDKSVCKPMDTYPVKRLDNQIARTLTNLVKAGQISAQDQRKVRSTGSVLPRFYDRPEIHKPNILLRPIVVLPEPQHTIC